MTTTVAAVATQGESKDDDEGEKERDDIRQERHKERARQRNIERAAPERQSKLNRERERDISEQIALGLPAKSSATGEGLFDQRLFNQAGGVQSGRLARYRWVRRKRIRHPIGRKEHTRRRIRRTDPCPAT